MSRMIILLFFLNLTSCVSYKIPTEAFLPPPIPQCPEECLSYQNKKLATEHWLYSVVPRHRCQIRWYDLPHWFSWAVLGNDEDGLFGEELSANYHPETPSTFSKAVKWTARNPLHNFTHYVIGTAYCKNSEITLMSLSDRGCDFLQYRPEGTTVFPSKNQGVFFALHGYKPFIAFRLPYTENRQWDFYLGWREKGNFGLKCNLFAKRNKRA